MLKTEDTRIMERLSEQKNCRYGGCWENEYAHLYDDIKSYEDLTRILNSNDPNTLIFTTRIASSIVDLLSPIQREDLKKRLEWHLKDGRMCDISATCSQSDEEDTTRVGEEAYHAIRKIKEIEEAA